MKRPLSFCLGVLMIVFSLCIPCLAAPAQTAQGAKIENLGIPTLSYFPDDSGRIYSRSTWSMEVFDGRIYIGCGDYDKNSGSWRGGMPVMAYDPQTKQWNKEYTVSDEQISRFVVSNDTLYIPSMDPTGNYGTGSIYYLKNGAWNTVTKVPRGVHIFDMQFTDNGNTIFAGLGTDEAIAPTVAYFTNTASVPSTDDMLADRKNKFKVIGFRRDGAILTGTDITMDRQYPSAYARCYNLFAYKGDIYATLYIHSSGAEAREKCNGLYRYDAAENVFDYYSNAPYDLMASSMSSSVDLIYKDKFILAYNNLYIFSDDLTSFTALVGGNGAHNPFRGRVTWARTIGDDLYFTTYEQKTDADGKLINEYISRMYKTSDLENFELMATLESGAYVRSFCYYDGVFYLGTEGARANASTDTGTIYAMTLQKADCAHTNIARTVTLATSKHQGLCASHCPDCGTQMSSVTFPHTDLKDDWYLDTVTQAYDRGLMNGTGEHSFSPGISLTRAMLVQVLYNLENKPAVTGGTPFIDIKEQDYYYDALRWAYANEIVNGASPNEFCPNNPITREQFATILYRYADKKGIDVSASADLSGYTDQNAVSNYARTAIAWANAHGYIGGVTATTLDPRGNTTRAQAATILIRFLDNKE